MTLPDVRGVLELLRLPSVLTVPGDSLVGAVWSAEPAKLRRAAPLATASSLLYLSGMALNDYADRQVDARERPGRPIPSGRVSPRLALAIASGLTAGGLAVAFAAGGRRATAVSGALAAVVWGYDMALKDTPAGPTTMACARALDVFMGASVASPRGALPAAAVTAAHTLTITVVSRREVPGATRALPRAALSASAAISAVAAMLAVRAGQDARGRIVALALLGAHTVSMVRAELAATRQPTASSLGRLVGTGVMAFMPLQASLLAARGAHRPALTLAATWPAARALARRVAVT
ncbi:MAG: SCO3242 family prenyltransferase [Solirubrobacteraceae bacterium]